MSAVCSKPCRHCGEPTEQRAQGLPYCSMQCIKTRGREVAQITYQCPYPDCGWSVDYLPDDRDSPYSQWCRSESMAQMMIAGHERDHRDE